ncbi:MAG: nitroreductase family protein [Muribaculaceae bacterium]|nr:nitroreductase family protein [Muribaculaceae bacterium]
MALSSCAQADRPASGAGCDRAEVVVDNIMTRTSIRRFTGAPIGQDTLEVLVKAGMAAPTAVNAQPWGFVVVTERAVLDSLDAVHPHAHLKTAGAAVVVCGDMEKALDGDNRAYWIQDCSAATENILLAAHAYGLGAVWCGVYPNQERIPGVRESLGLPGSVIPLNIITIGHPADASSQPKDKWDPARVHYNRW